MAFKYQINDTCLTSNKLTKNGRGTFPIEFIWSPEHKFNIEIKSFQNPSPKSLAPTFNPICQTTRPKTKQNSIPEKLEAEERRHSADITNGSTQQECYEAVDSK